MRMDGSGSEPLKGFAIICQIMIVLEQLIRKCIKIGDLIIDLKTDNNNNVSGLQLFPELINMIRKVKN